jgi:parvulin-like peptidyl-prolyl isomerase
MALIVGGERIEDSAVQREVERLKPDYERVFKDKSPQERQAQLLDWSKENLIERVLLIQHARRYEIQIPKAEVESAFEQTRKQHGTHERLREEFGTTDENQIKELIESRMKVERLLQGVCESVPEPSREDVAKYYEQNKDQFRSVEQVRVAHVVKHINWQTDEHAASQTIMKAQDELKSGAVFEIVVAKYSDCPDNGGDLGYITRGEMVEEFDDVVFNLGANETSPVFRTRFGFHIAKVYDRRPATVLPLKEVTDRVISQMKEQMYNNALDEFIDQLKSKTKIEEV